MDIPVWPMLILTTGYKDSIIYKNNKTNIPPMICNTGLIPLTILKLNYNHLPYLQLT